MASIAKTFQDGLKRHAFTAREAREGMDRISPAPVEVPLQRVDLVIEAAVEKLELKKQFSNGSTIGQSGNHPGHQHLRFAHFGTRRQHAPARARGRFAFL